MERYLLPSTDNKYLINFHTNVKYGIFYKIIYDNKGKLIDVEIQQMI